MDPIVKLIKIKDIFANYGANRRSHCLNTEINFGLYSANSGDQQNIAQVASNFNSTNIDDGYMAVSRINISP